jgi:hypothetical protein
MPLIDDLDFFQPRDKPVLLPVRPRTDLVQP